MTPTATYEKRLFIVRDDGVIFGDGGHLPLEKLALELVLPEIPWLKSCSLHRD
jgi:hypothetical protein